MLNYKIKNGGEMSPTAIKPKSKKKKRTVAERRNYRVKTVAQAKKITQDWINKINLKKSIGLGLPEVDDRYHLWRIALTRANNHERIGH